MSSTELLDAASSSYILKLFEFSRGLIKSNSLISLANILAQVVFPTPLGPQKRRD